MPPDPSHSQSRRAIRKTSHDEDLEARRSRGEISCAECRRLKLKCDKRIPCSTCVRRGCPSICPNGNLASGQGTRFVLADTSELHAKIADMGKRIRELEDALAISHSSTSNEPHPLLRDELMYIKYGPDNGMPASLKEQKRESSAELANALGTLTIGGPEEVKYFGRSAGSEAGADVDQSPYVDEVPSLDGEVFHLANLFPLSLDGQPQRVFRLLYDSLPEQPRAWSLCETYLEHASWQFGPILRDELIQDILTPIYKGLKERRDYDSIISPHKLAVLFAVLAQGSLVDLTLRPNNTEAESYFQLSRAAFSLRAVFDSPELATVQAVVLVASYHTMAGKRYTMDSTWIIFSLGCKLAQSRSLELRCEDGSKETIFILGGALLRTSLPIPTSYVDCEFPIDEGVTMDKDGNLLTGFYQWKYEFCRDILPQVLELTLAAEPPSYETILYLDRQVREKILPPHLNTFMNGDEQHFTPSTYMRGCLLGSYRSVTLLYIHRSYFAQAILTDPVNPLRSPYAPSFLAAYRCATGIIKASLNHFERFPDLCSRWWSIWTHRTVISLVRFHAFTHPREVFSAALIVGIIVTRSPSSIITPHAFLDLGLACSLFEKGAPNTKRARSALHILRRLRNKAFEVYSQYKNGNPTVSSLVPDYGEDELALFGGQTKILFSKFMASRWQHNRLSSLHGSPTNSETPPSSGDQEFSLNTRALADAHPSLVNYLSSLPATQGFQAALQASPDRVDPYSEKDALPSLYALPEGPNPLLQRQHFTCDSPNQGDRYPFSMVAMADEAMVNNEPSSAGFTDFDMMFSMPTGKSGIDENWDAFMRDLGILDPSYVVPNTTT
ncbi:hypothetical protein WG66_009912 [Moniliophthora roreri]|nr:hypothetical protein WG66_009912 [Moniliophthora roreri]